MGASLIFGFIPTDVVVFARIIPSCGWKFSISARGKAWPPTFSASDIESQKTIQSVMTQLFIGYCRVQYCSDAYNSGVRNFLMKRYNLVV